MLIYWIVFLVMSFIAFKNWRLAALIWFPVQFLFNEYCRLLYPSVQLGMATTLVIFFFFFYKSHNIKKENFIFAKIFVLYIISDTLIYLFAEQKDGLAGGMVRTFVINFVFLYILQNAIKEIRDIQILTFFFAAVGIIFSLLAVYEVINHDNPWLDFVWLNAPGNEMYYKPPFVSLTGELQLRYGVVRAYSVFTIHILLGVTSVTLLYYLGYYLKTYLNVGKLEKGYLLASVICLILGAFLSNSKTPLVGLVFVLLTFFSLKKIFRIQYITLAVIVFFIIASYFPDYLTNIYALFDSSLAEEGRGSTVALRSIQYNAAFDLFLKKPIFGWGDDYKFPPNIQELILGLESSWMQLSVRRGLVGILIYLFSYYIYFILLKKHYSTKQIMFTLGGLMAMETATGLMNFNLQGGLILIIIKLGQLSKDYSTVEKLYAQRK